MSGWIAIAWGFSLLLVVNAQVDGADPELSAALAGIAVAVVAPLGTEFLKRWDVFKARPNATNTMICCLVMIAGWFAFDFGDQKAIIEYLWHGLGSAQIGAVGVEAMKNRRPEEWKTTTGKIRTLGGRIPEDAE